MTYAEYLAAQGATADEIKVLDVPIARKAWEASEAARTAAAERAASLETWYNEKAVPAYKKMEQDMLTARAEAARNAEFVKAASDQGLIELAEKAGVKQENIQQPPPANANYITRDSLAQDLRPLMDQVGDQLASFQDMVMEHTLLFPDQPLNVAALRREALAANTTVIPYWQKKFNVDAARTARAKAAADAHDAKIREEGAAAARAEFASRYGNPDTRPLVASSNPLAARPATGRDKQPWELGGNEVLERDRVKRATEKLISTQVTQTRN